MWQKEGKTYEIKNDLKNVIDEYKIDDNFMYFYVQLIFSFILIVTAFMLKAGNSSTFIYAKNSYSEFFEKDSYAENNFSYKVFAEKLEKEISYRFTKFTDVFNNINGKGTSGETPWNCSTKKIYINDKGIAPVDGYVSSRYGIRKNPFNSKEKDFHTGLDIAAMKGTFIKSSFDGIVIDAGYSETAGNYIKIKSDNDIETMYAHCQFVLSNVDDYVIAGQVIATVGNTGKVTGPHLHFEFKQNGVKYNPIYAVKI